MNSIHPIIDLLRSELGVLLSSTLARLLLAVTLGGIIGLERQLRHKPAGLRTNMFICFGAAMFTVLSHQLAGTPSDSARIAAQIIPGIGFIGAGSILHARASVTGLTTAATIFVVASVGMAAGGGLYLTAVLATVIILVALELLGRMEAAFSLKSFVTNYEVTGRSVDGMLREVNRPWRPSNSPCIVCTSRPPTRISAWSLRWTASMNCRACFPSGCTNRVRLPA